MYKGEPSMEKNCNNCSNKSKDCFIACRDYNKWQPIEEVKTMEKRWITEQQARELYLYTMNAQDEIEAIEILKKMKIIKKDIIEEKLEEARKYKPSMKSSYDGVWITEDSLFELRKAYESVISLCQEKLNEKL
jgi:hypothetical protein